MPPRTKACAICRKKRIKCDATLPQCLMCVRTGRTCPGIPDGPLIIDMTSIASKPKQNSNKNPKNPLSTEAESLSGKPKPRPAHHIYPDWLVGTKYDLGIQMATSAVFTEAFYATFLSYFTATGEGLDLQNRQTWLHQLPLLSSDGTNEALTLAVRATAAAYCGTETKNPALVRSACKVYGAALSAHSRVLSKSRAAKRVGANGDPDVTVHMVSTSVMFSIFEAMRATTADAYREHIYGAARMLEVTGPGQCMYGVLCQLFFHIRTQMAFVYLTMAAQNQHREPKRLEVKKILVENLLYEKLPMFQRLMNHVAALAEIYVGMREAASKKQFIDLSAYTKVKADVEALWLEYQDEAERRKEKLLWDTAYGFSIRFRDGFTALSIAYFCAARILFAVLAPRVAASYVDLTDQYGMILKCADYLRTPKIGCAYMRMATPLYLVALHSPNAKQKAQARSVFAEWQNGTMAGVSTLALEGIRMMDGEQNRWKDDGSRSAKETPKLKPETKDIPLSLFRSEDWVGQM